ncbi:MAG TPA: FtsX-like permease family protein [Fimbriimonadaceae bacterium]|nr:FtsX-like permease family protein [Fimbriimonadaceae bacterium]
MLLRLASRNLWRQPVRTWLSILTIALASALLVFSLSFQLSFYGAMKESSLRVTDGFAQVQPKGYQDDPDIRKTVGNANDLAARIARIPGIAAAPRGSAYAILANGPRSFGAEVLGIDPAPDSELTTLHAKLSAGRWLRAGDSGALVMGDALARNLGVSPGDKVSLVGSAADGSIAADGLVLVGEFHSGIGDLDRQVAEIPLARFQETFALGGKANVLLIGGRSLDAVDRALPDLRRIANQEGLEVKDWGELEPALKQAITLDFSTGMIWYVSLIAIVAFIVFNALLMAVLERTREFGMLLAVGMRSESIAKMLWLELCLLALVGNGAGILLGGSVAYYFERQGMTIGGLQGVFADWGLPSRLFIHVTPASLLAGPAAITGTIALAGGLLFARRVRRIDPAAAMGGR